jgi:hypothetical protein
LIGGRKMVCEVIKIGRDCAFMTRKGCSFNGGKCYPVVDRCQGCERVAVFPAGQYCIACPDPAAKWSARGCNLSTNITKEKAPEVVKSVDPLKASKRKAAGKA